MDLNEFCHQYFKYYHRASHPVNDISGYYSEVQILGYFEEYNFPRFLNIPTHAGLNQGSYCS